MQQLKTARILEAKKKKETGELGMGISFDLASISDLFAQIFLFSSLSFGDLDLPVGCCNLLKLL